MLDPQSAIGAIYSVAKLIYDQVQLVKANEKQCITLANRIRIIETAVHGLDEIKDKEQYEAGLNELLNVLKQCLEFIKKFTDSSNWYLWIFKTYEYKNTFEGLVKALIEAIDPLNLGLNAQQIVNREDDKRDKQADTKFIKENQLLILDLNEKMLKEQQGIHLEQQEKQEILRLQMVEIQSQLKAAIEGKSNVKEVRPSIDPNHHIHYYDLVFENLIAAGSFGKVYLGKWAGQTVAIKTLEGKLTLAEEQRFIREVAIMSRLRHPNITTFFGACLEDNHACLVMEYMEKKSLDYILKEKPLTPEEQKSLSLDIARGLLYLHHQDILHRDLASGNILVNAQGVAKLVDFGLSKTNATSVQTSKARSEALPWQAPEFFSYKGEYTKASDIYSFGVVLWEIMTGKLPVFDESRLGEYVKMGGRETIPSNTPTALATLIQQCWELDPTKRPDIKNVIRQLEAYQTPSAEAYYSEGQTFELQKDFLKAFQNYQKSADKGYVKAKTNLGYLYLTSSNSAIPQNKPKALECFLEAGSKGHIRAMVNAANMLEYGDGIPSNKGEALLWYQKICDKEPNNTVAVDKCQKLKSSLV